MLQKRKIIPISLSIIFFLMFWFMFFAMNHTLGTYQITKGNVKVEVIIQENLLSLQEAEYKKLITLKDGERKYDQEQSLHYASNSLKFSLIKREDKYGTFWVIRDEDKGIASADWGIYKWFCLECSDHTIDGDDVVTFTFDKSEWHYEANN